MSGRRYATISELLVLAGKAGLLALYLLALVAGIRRHDGTQTLVLLAPVALGAVWHYRAPLMTFARLEHHPTHEKESAP